MKTSLIRRILCLAAALCLLPLSAALGESYPFIGFTQSETPLRQQPTEYAPVQRLIPAGDAVIVSGENGNYYIALYNGVQGYALKSYLGGNVTLPAPQPTAVPQAPAQSAYTTLYSGVKAEEAVRALQQALEELDFYTGKIDGDFGGGTRNAVISFQKKNGLSATGTADGQMQQLLFEGKPKNNKGKAVSVKTVSYLPGAEISSGDQGDAVKKLQARLTELGYYTGSLDGECGSGTVRAIKDFQKKVGMAQSGKADRATLNALYAQAAPNLYATATPKPVYTPIPTNAPTPVPDARFPFATYTTSSVNFRKGPSTDSVRLATIPKGGEITVEAIEGDYLKIIYNNQKGYVMAQYAYVPDQYLPGKAMDTDTEAQQNYPQLKYGSTGNYVALLQEALNELGFYTGSFHGSFDNATYNAVKNFQKKNNIKQDGIATPEMQQLIYEGKPKNSKGSATNIKLLPPIDGYEMKLNDKGDNVTRLQQQLNLLGYYTADYTRVFNSATQKAVKAFQKDHNMTVDGLAGKKTLTLLSALADQMTAPTPAPDQPAPTNPPLTEQNVIVMQNGTRGQAVERLQERLVALGYYNITPDGIYNSNDISAVREFQRKNGLKVDGIAGLETQLVLYSDSALPATSAALPKPTAAPKVTPAPTPAITETLRIGSKGQAVVSLQQRLKQLGYYNGEADGLFGTGTARSVTLFQRANNLDADGVAGEKTLKKLYSNTVLSVATPKPTAKPSTPSAPTTQGSTNVTLKMKSKGTEVKNLQLRLMELGYLNSADGIFGVQTYNAVAAFQRKNGLTADGVAGKMTLSRLYSSAALGNGNSILLPTPPSIPEQEETAPGFKAPDPSEVRYANWFTEIRSRARLMPDVVIYDPDSGLHFNLHMFSFGKHADSEPPTKEDTEILYQINGKDSWDPKYVWVIFSDGRVYIASIHSNGHTVDHTNDNGMTGHICLHFPRIMSEAEATGPYAVRHQKEILYGWQLTQAKIR